MRHRVGGKQLNRDKDHRKALLRNLATSVILNGNVKTSVTKAKFVKPFLEKLITLAKVNSFSSLTNLRKKITNEDAIRKLISEIAPMNLNRPGGYTRIKKTGKVRIGDSSEVAVIELVTSENTGEGKNEK
jgi:large subunit ribosomal protein L17